MSDTANVPSIQVTIGRQTRLYHAFVTTAPPAFDAPSTLTLYEGTLINVLAFASDTAPLHASRAKAPARLILIDTAELAMAARELPSAIASPHSGRSGAYRIQHPARVVVATAAAAD